MIRIVNVSKTYESADGETVDDLLKQHTGLKNPITPEDAFDMQFLPKVGG